MWELAVYRPRTYVRTIPIPAEPAGLTDVVRWPWPTRGHLCLIRDHVSPYWYIRGVTPHSHIRRR
jgi:hypothetical protein